ncbi:MAG: hypothetical protein PHH29_17085 [Desulfuromonadaceae bacterium]|nr:hypothetical protein [Desulfuromonadaceae bacterium]
MRVGSKYISKSDLKDYIIITKVEGEVCYYNFFTSEGIIIGREATRAAIEIVLGWGTLVNPRIKY